MAALTKSKIAPSSSSQPHIMQKAANPCIDLHLCDFVVNRAFNKLGQLQRRHSRSSVKKWLSVCSVFKHQANRFLCRHRVSDCSWCALNQQSVQLDRLRSNYLFGPAAVKRSETSVGVFRALRASLWELTLGDDLTLTCAAVRNLQINDDLL